MTTTTQPQTRAELLRVTAAALLAIADDPKTPIEYLSVLSGDWVPLKPAFTPELQACYLRIARTPEEIEKDRRREEKQKLVDEWNEGGRAWVMEFRIIYPGNTHWMEDLSPELTVDVDHMELRRKAEPPEPKCRPWTQGDDLFGKIIVRKFDGLKAIVLSQRGLDVSITTKEHPHVMIRQYPELLEEWQQPDGTPCGELEGEG